MGLLSTLKQDPRAALFDMLDDVRAGMLGLTAEGQGMQPMSHFPDPEADAIWFITSAKTDLARAVGSGSAAVYAVVAEDHDGHASITGTLRRVQDAAKLDQLWNPAVGAWFDGGRDDPDIALLRFDPQVAEVWASTSSSLKFGFEMVRSSLDQDHRPDLGEKATVRFSTRA